MFCDIKNLMDDPDVKGIMAECVFENSPEGMDRVKADYLRHGSWQLYGWVEDGVVVGICGFEEHLDWVEILHIAVAERARGLGLGSKMIGALAKQYKKAIEAETDDDAVDFYRKCGFEVTTIRKYDVRRWACVLPVAGFVGE